MSASRHQVKSTTRDRNMMQNLERMFELRSKHEKLALLEPKSSTNITMRLNLCMLLLCTISLYLVVVVFTAHSVSASYYRQNHEYDPEQNDGIPVFSARSIAKMDDDWTNSMQESIRPRAAAQRRQSDNDLEDGLEEDDDDEYRSGSSPHESVASPSYGESQRFARDGDEIEDFFDKHLGPPKETDSVDSESSNQPMIAQQEATVPATVPMADPDDQFEAAASGPLSSIFQSLLGHSQDTKQSKRPFLQITTSSSADSDATTTKDEPTKATASSTGLKASQSAQSFVEASPVALAIAPVAASSLQEQSGIEQDPSGAIEPGVREIYIGRRPTVMSYLQQQQQQQPKTLQHLSGYTTAGSANIWRGPNGQPVVYEQEQANDYSRYPVAASYAYQQQPSQSASESAAGGTGGAGGDDDGETVTYGLSFGGGSSAAADEPAQEQEAVDHAGSGQVESQPSDQARFQAQGYAPYNTRYTTSSTRALNNYYNNYYRQPVAGYVRAYPVQAQQQMFRQQQQMVPMHYQSYHQQPQQQHYMGNAPTRYHRDPSESSTQSAPIRASLIHRGANHDPSNYDGMVQHHHHRGLGRGSSQAGASGEHARERQRLLASLDREIKASPQYKANHATTGDASAQRSSYMRVPAQSNGQRQLVTYKEVNNNYLGDDLDTYNSYHSETDPYKTQTTTSRMVNDPLAMLTRGRPQSAGYNGLGSNVHNSDPASTSNSVANQSPEMNYHSGQSYQQQANGLTGGQMVDSSASNGASMQPNQQRLVNSNMLTGPLINYDKPNNQMNNEGDLMRNSNNNKLNSLNNGNGATINKDDTIRVPGHSRVRRDDSDEREIDNDTDDDGVWVDDDEEDDNRQQSSDVNETSQHPEEDEEEDDGQQDDASNNVLTPSQLNPPGVIGGPHGYELSPNDLMIYHG